jgi:hypothetical protein
LGQERTSGPQIADPIALRINQESRGLALTYYKRRSELVEPGEGYYIDYKIDSLYFNISLDDGEIFPRLSKRTYFENGVLHKFDVTWLIMRGTMAIVGPG